MMQHRLAVAATFLAAISLTIAGCSSPTPKVSGTTDGTALSGTLTIAAASSAKPDLDPIIVKFKTANPGVEVTATYADNQQYQATIRTQLSAGTAPDIFYVWPGNGNPGAMEVLAPNGYLKDLSTIKSISKVPDALKSVTQIGGKQYVFPMTVAGIGAIYNEQAVTAGGVRSRTSDSVGDAAHRLRIGADTRVLAHPNF
jgi:raffinose/stachyose/melibiose transport system substrate-binding protein